MIALLNKISSHRIRLDVVEGKLKLYSEKNTVDADLIAEIKANKEALISYLLETKNVAENKPKNLQIPAIPEASDYPVSSAQKRLWVISKFDENSVAYNLPFTMDIPVIEENIIVKSIKSLLERHEILRTYFISNAQGDVRQKVVALEDAIIKIHYKDLSNQKNGAADAADWIAEDKRKPFRLNDFPLFRVAVFKIDENHCLLYFNIHHIICDGWSLEILQKEFIEYCESHLTGRKHTLTPLDIQYKDYASFQNKRIHSEEFSVHKNYWLQKLTHPLPVLKVTANTIRPVLKNFEGKQLQSILAPEKFASLKQFVIKNSGSVFSGLISIWFLLLHKYSNQKEIIIGTPVAGREHWALMDQIGFYVNMLPLKITINTQESYTEFYQRLKNDITSDFEHQNYPFDTLINDLKIVRDHSRNAVFDVMMTYIQKEDFVEKNTNAYEDVEDLGRCFAKFDMEIECINTVNSIAIKFKYNSAIYSHEFMAQFVSHYHQLLTEILAKPNDPIASYSCLGRADKEQLIKFSNKQTNAYDAQNDATFLTLFEAQVSKNPDGIALRYDTQKMSYQELANSSDRFALFLREKHQIQPNDFVGVQLKRNEFLIVAILGIIKAGAVYIPIPEDSRTKEKIQYDSNYKICVDAPIIAEFKKASIHLETHFNTIINKEQLAYIIYTSGTTGMPKGVMISHDNLYVFLKNLEVNFGMNSVANFAATTKITFDISILEIFGTLALGKEMILFSDAQLENPALFLQALETYKIEGLQVTPSRIKQLQYISEFSPKYLRLLLVGGEAVDHNLHQSLQENNARTYNVYGPTETTIWSSCVQISTNNSVQSIGKPLQDESIYILNEELQMVPIGVVGEVYIGGKGVAKGYLNREQLTKERFIRNPLDTQERLYKTGDLGKWHHSGVIQFMGRKDDQVKIRGHRIELSEITAVLKNYESIKEVQLIIQENNHGEQKIVAFFTASTTVNITKLITYARSVLQTHKIPSHFVQLAEFKLNNSGKVDVVALRNYKITSLVDTTSYEKPKTAFENIIAKVWAEVLQIPISEISANANFYNLGGDSVSSIKVLTRLQQMGHAVEVKDILLYPLLNTLAKRLQENITVTDVFEPVRLEWAVFSNYHHLADDAPNYVIIHDGNGELFGYRLLLEKLQKTHNVWGFVMEKDSLAPSIITPYQMSKAYAEILEQTFTNNHTIHLLGWSFGGYIAYQMADILENNKSSISLKTIVMIDTMNYVNTNYEAFYQEAFFEKDHTLSITKEKEMVKAICPNINVDEISENSVIDFWEEISQKITKENFDYQIPDYWNAHFKKLYPTANTLTAFQKMNQLRTIGLHIPVPYTNSLKHTEIVYIKAASSNVDHQLFWKKLTKAPFTSREVSGSHGTVMETPHVEEVFQGITNTKIDKN